MKTILITGGSSGIGKAFAQQFIQNGYDNIILVARNEQKLAQTRQKLLEISSQATIVIEPLDLSEEKNLIYLTNKYPVVDTLINCAGMVNINPSYKVDNDHQLKLIRLSIEATCFLSNFYIQSMIERHSDKVFRGIINVASIVVLYNFPLTNVYTPSKFFIDKYSQTLNYEIKRQFKDANIHVMSLRPGGVDTGFIDENKFITLRKFCDKHKSLNLFLTPQFVAENATKDFFKKKAVSIPGAFYKCCNFLTKILPEKLWIKLTYDIISKELK